MKNRNFKILLLLLSLFFTAINCWSQDNHFLNATDFSVDNTGTSDNYNALDDLFTDHPNSDIYLPPGIYIINNNPSVHANGYLNINNYQGHLLAAGNAIIRFTYPSGGLNFIGGTGAKIENLHIEYSTLPTTRNDLHAINIGFAQNTIVNNITVNGSGGVGLLFNLCYNPQVSNIHVTNTMADGCSFYSCENVQLNGLITENTGDDALAFFNYNQKPDLDKATVSNLIIKESYARGIAINGTSDIKITNFSIDSTSGPGIYVSKETSVYSGPANICISNGNVNYGGVLTGRGTTGSKHGISITAAAGVYLDNIAIKHSKEKGLSVYNTKYADISHIAVDSSGTIDVLADLNTKVVLKDISSTGAGEYGFKATRNTNVIAENIAVTNAWRGTSTNLHRAIWFELNENFFADQMTVIDDTPTAALAYIAGEYNTTGSGYFGDIKYKIAAGTPSFSLAISSANVKSGFVNLLPKDGVTNGVVYQGAKSLLTTPAGTTGQLLTYTTKPEWVTPAFATVVNGPASTSFTGATSYTVTYTTPGFTPSNVLWTPTGSIGSSGWYITNITSTGFTINFSAAPSGTVTGKYTLIK
ncbi:right-handed parallel beta-helix repeat-containing protein [Flavobacterium sp. RHBU_3]|uniref:right-handed parallel beta-helix repeat-containing protein n=1 Tax=Flavobacterium sp. RHBU_3 TaxID=3391184 RepID=UPI003984AAE2